MLVHWLLDSFGHTLSYTKALLLFDDHGVCKRTSVRTVVLVGDVRDAIVPRRKSDKDQPAFRLITGLQILPLGLQKLSVLACNLRAQSID